MTKLLARIMLVALVLGVIALLSLSNPAPYPFYLKFLVSLFAFLLGMFLMWLVIFLIERAM